MHLTLGRVASQVSDLEQLWDPARNLLYPGVKWPTGSAMSRTSRDHYVSAKGTVVPTRLVRSLVVLSSSAIVVGFAFSIPLFVAGCLCLLVAIAFVGICWSQPVRRTDTELRVAGGSILLGDIDPEFGVQMARDVFDETAIDLRTSATSDERSVVLNAKTETLLFIEAHEREELLIHLSERFTQSPEDHSIPFDDEPPLVERIKRDLLYPMAVILFLLVLVFALAVIVL